MDETIRETSPGAAKRLETLIHDISPRKAGVASFKTISPKSRLVSMKESAGILESANSPESARSSRISKIRRTCGIQPNRQDSPVSARLIESDGLRPRLYQDRATVPHSSPQLGDLSLEARPSSRVSLDFFGFVGCYSRGPRALCMTVV